MNKHGFTLVELMIVFGIIGQRRLHIESQLWC
jgi:prepilin-type N-terminal cleavage/methylation domain-containing protein